MSVVEESLSSSVELIPASPSPQRPAPDRTRLLTWHTPRQPRRSSPSPDRSDDSPLASVRRRRPGAPVVSDDEDSPAPGGQWRHSSVLLISDDDDDVVADTPPAPERRRARPQVRSEDESDDSDTAPRGQRSRPAGGDAAAAASAAGGPDRSDRAVHQPASEAGVSDGSGCWGTPAAVCASSGEEAASGADSSIGSAAGDGRGSSDCGGTTGQATSRPEDPRDRAQRLYSKYTIKKRAGPPSEPGRTGGGPDHPPAGGQLGRAADDAGRRATGDAGQKGASPTTAASQTLTGDGDGDGDGGGKAGSSAGRQSSRTAPTASSSPSTCPDPVADSDGAEGRRQSTEDGMDLSHLSVAELEQRLKQKEMVARVSNLSALPDAGLRLRSHIEQLRSALERRRSAARHSATGARPAGAGGGGAAGGPAEQSDGTSQLQRVQAQITQKKMQYSTSAHRSDPAAAAQLRADISRLEKEMIRLQMARPAGGTGGGWNPFALNASTVSRPVALNRPRGEAARPLAPGPDPAAELESALRRGQPTTSVVTAEQRRLEAEARESLRDFGQIRPQLTAALLASNPELGRLYGGRMTDARHRQASNVTSEVLERLHRSLETLPAPSAAEAGPACLNVPLMPHQQYALSWLQWRESQLPAGGILADDMGLGKTLTMIAHCLRAAELERLAAEKAAEDGGDGGDAAAAAADSDQKKSDTWLSKDKPVKEDRSAPEPTDATLIVCPASVLLQWEAEVKRRTAGGVTTIVYHGPNRQADRRRIRKANFVMTTYDLVRQEVEKDGLIGANKAVRSPLVSFTWKRIILDEAHQIRNRNTKSSKAVCELHAGRRWMLSGTPIQNGREDLFSLMRFLRAAPFNEYEVWKRWIDKSPRGDERLSLIVRAMVLRRTKDQISPTTGKPLVALPVREKISHQVELESCERQVYDKVFAFCRSSLQEFIKLQEQREYEKELRSNPQARPPPGLSATVTAPGAGTATDMLGDPSGLGQKGSIKQHHLLVQLLRLRQICCHPGLAKTVITSSDREAAGVDAEEDAADLQRQLMSLSLNESEPVRGETVLSADNPVFNPDWCSSKLRRLMQEVDEIVAAGQEKLVIVSQWTSMLDIVREHLAQARVACCTISGSVKMSERQQLIETFNGPRGRGPRVMLLSLLAGGVGLNLVGGNHLFILDPHWNPQLEEQAGDRIYRVGQTRGVFIHRFVCKDTLEERIVELQQRKLTIASGVLSGDKQAASNRLTLSDLKMLFNVS